MLASRFLSTKFAFSRFVLHCLHANFVLVTFRTDKDSRREKPQMTIVCFRLTTTVKIASSYTQETGLGCGPFAAECGNEVLCVTGTG